MVNWDASNPLLSLTHLDGRNAAKLFPLRPYFSEYAWMGERLAIMARYAGQFSPKHRVALKRVVVNFSPAEAQKVLRIEKTTNHDLKALEEYVIRKVPGIRSAINFGIGSEDINNIALARILKRVRGEVLVPELKKLATLMAKIAAKEKDTVMLARTHGLPAGLTTFGKELANPLLRLCDEVEIFVTLPLRAKLSGEVGTFHASSRVLADTDLLELTDNFLKDLGLTAHHGATQIVPYDDIVRFLHSLYRINGILLDLSQNMWLYVLLGYLSVLKKERESGSAGMPHKVNPMYFEGAEGGLIMANGIIEALARKLPINRLQRDFSDSTIRRNLVLPIAYSLLSFQSLEVAFARIAVKHEALNRDIAAHAEVWIEPIKLILLSHGYKDAYQFLKEKTRGRLFTAEQLASSIKSWSLPNREEEAILNLVADGRPANPYPARIVGEAVGRVRKVFR